jgi:peptidoglycan/xylan/chitin deacetylase (PgdA/CDA1 family)
MSNDPLSPIPQARACAFQDEMGLTGKRSKIADLLKEVSHRTGLARRRLRHRAFPGAAVLCYHGVRTGQETERFPIAPLHVLESELDEQLRVISGECQPVDLETLLAAVRGEKELPERAVLVTFDDGYRSMLRRAAPLLERYRVPATMFLCTGPLETQRWFWFDAVALAEGDDAVERWKRTDIGAWEKRLAAVGPADPESPCAPLTVDEARELARRPGISIGAHSVWHPILANCSPERQRQEMEGSARQLESWLGARPLVFAYPNGAPQLDFDAATLDLARAAGFVAAFSTRPGFARPTEDPFALPRFLMLAGVSGAELAHRLAFSWHSAKARRRFADDADL